MRVGYFINRLVNDFFTSESFWHNEVTDLLKMFPFLYETNSFKKPSNSKERYYELYPLVSKNQDECYDFLQSWLSKSIENNDKKIAKIKSQMSNILQDMQRCKIYFTQASVVRRRVLLARWNINIAAEQIKSSRDPNKVSLFGLTMLPDKIIDLISADKKINSLEIYDSKDISLSESIEKLKKIRYLAINNSNLEHIPVAICKLKNLNELSLSSNSIRNLPIYILELNKLKKLDLSYNYINQLPINNIKFNKFMKKLGFSEDEFLRNQKTSNMKETIGSYWAKRLQQQNLK